MVKILFVCLGNICRSPTAQGLFEHKARAHGIHEHIEVDSAGTGDWHVGESPDPRAQEEARRNGIDISHQRGRQIHRKDFEKFDYVIAMDEENHQHLKRICPRKYQDRVYRMTHFAPHRKERDVPDPYFGHGDGFARVYNLLDDCAEGLIETIRREHLHDHVN